MEIDDQSYVTKKDLNLSLSRRAFCGLLGKGCIVVAFGGVLRLLEGKDRFTSPLTAIPENEFLSLCIRCQKCINVCPYKVVSPVSFLESIISVGTPQIKLKQAACRFNMYMGCSGFCAMECPTGALRI
jgi:ferredoxin-type protein NapG